MKFSHQHYLLGTYKILAGSHITVFYRWQIWSFKRLTAWDKPSGPHIQAQLRFPSRNARFSNVLGFNFSAFNCGLGTTLLWRGDCTGHWRNFSGIFSPLTRCWWYPIFNSGQQKPLKVLSNTSWERSGHEECSNCLQSRIYQIPPPVCYFVSNVSNSLHALLPTTLVQ